MWWQYSVNQIIRDNWEDIKTQKWANAFKIKHLYALKICRTKDLGGHIDGCEKCAFYKIAYNSCGNRHCPTCGALKREKWIARQEEKLLKVPCFHLVFTLPHELNELCLQHPRVMYSLLFRTAWLTVQAFAKDEKFLGAKTGMTAVLHTWGQQLSLHPHVHCIVPGGGLTADKKWKTTRNNGKYLFPKAAMRKVFKGKFMAALKGLATSKTIDLPNDLREKLYRKKWVVYAKRPFAKPGNSLPRPHGVIEYLGRYTHKSAISNYRIEQVKNGEVTFKYKVYKKGGKVESMSLPTMEFIRRFALHILPHGFARMRHYGILSSRGQSTQLPVIQANMNIIRVKKSPKHSFMI
ncbi:MAG: IS91 family transposase [Bacteroidetes bacterium]|nr:MAG: IS91 family transposase [Bacteroidota bacterium]